MLILTVTAKLFSIAFLPLSALPACNASSRNKEPQVELLVPTPTEAAMSYDEVGILVAVVLVSLAIIIAFALTLWTMT